MDVERGRHLLEAGTGRRDTQTELIALTRRWAFDQLTGQPAGIARPPRDEVGTDDYLPAATTTGGENAREALAEETMGPLLVWVIRLVEDLTDGILTAHAAARRHLARDGSVRYDNPNALLLCLYRRDRALCAKDGRRDAPSLDRCVPGRGNIVRTDQHAAQLRERAEVHDRTRATFTGAQPMSPVPDERDRIRTATDRILTSTPERSNTCMIASRNLPSLKLPESGA
ncbi:hypothetical protein [Kitasatospora phosalacinea]|uniref:Uncharacterized protein n=1 Tax=Kitasatospora phosalacinea TaxID=2065 RepID=A0A9W6UUI6_9ACTN|nr:hypothetical protein [Kitasatospora phosalacinea]GLW59610.1 hypothetical protein Kpho01_76200 [Kitasatospora phosalacinea]